MTENNRRKAAFRDEALSDLAKMDGVPDEFQAQTIYKLDCYACTLHDVANPKSSNCRDNPYCINRLGLEKFDKLIKEEEKKAATENSQQTRRKIGEIPCGLVNLGNFCYVNSFLQVFFNDPVFRQKVYDWRPSPDFVKPEGTLLDVQAVMTCLQKIFFYLEFTPYEDTKTFEFTQLLLLQNAQQDAQEFTIMFFDALTKRLASHPNGTPFIEFLKKRYYGKTKTRTWCKCGGRDNHEIQPFLAIQIPIEGYKSLLKAMEHHFSVETLHECRCNACGQQDQVCRQTEITELPDVLLIQLNRYVNDYANGCHRKLRSALAYPRTIPTSLLQSGQPDGEDSVYELFAVMIHEGDNTHCGHYYDLIKDPYTEQWFKYNDNEVLLQPRAPGFDTRANTSKPTKDMQGCYGLLYRRKTKIELCVPPSPEISDIWRAEFDSEFENDTGAVITKNNNRVKEVRHRYSELNNVFGQLKAHTDRYKNTKNLCFIPLALLTDVIEKELVYAKKMLELAEKEESEADESMTEMSSPPPKRGRGKTRLAREEIAVMLKSSSMKLCPHGMVSVESVLYGDVKVVSRNSAENLLSRYNFVLKRISSMGETSGNMLTGKDICIDCLKSMQDEANFKEQLDATVKLAAKILKEKHRDTVNPKHQKQADHFYVSKKALLNLRKLAEQQWRFTNWNDDEAQLFFIPNHQRVQQPAISCPPILINGDSKGKKRRARGGSEDPSTSYAVAEDFDFSVVKEVVNCLVDNVATELNGVIHESREVSSAPSELDRNGVAAEDGGSRPPTPPSVKPEAVVFNDLLQCPHGGVNLPEFRFMVSPDEWAELIAYFPSVFTVKCTDTVCDTCMIDERTAQQDREDRTKQKKVLNQQFGDLTRNLDRRAPEQHELGTKYKLGICSNFVTAMRDAFKRSTDVFDLPPLCQECLKCEHGKPFKPVAKPPYNTHDPQIVPIQQKEWDQLTAQWPAERQEELKPVRILAGGKLDEFCDICHGEYMQAKKIDRMMFDEANIFVLLMDSANTAAAEPKRGATRRNQKNLYKFKMASSDTVKQLKLKLYEKIHQTPGDQLIFNNDQLLENEMTLFQAQVEPNNAEAPLRLHVNTVHPTVTFNEDREIEMGFRGTALTN